MRKIVKPNTRVHDYRTEHRGWGHDYTFTPRNGGLEAHAMGWGSGIEVGDTLLFSHKSAESRESPYTVVSISYFLDPSDMWSAELRFAPRDVT